MHGGAGPFAHHVIERASDQQEEQQRDRGVEIGVRAAVNRFVQAQREGEQDADGDRNVHVGPAVAQALPGRAEEDAARIGKGGQRDQRRNPVEQVAGCGLRAGPDRDRQQHDVAGREARDGERADQFRHGAVFRIRGDIVEMRFVSDRPQGFDQWRRRAVSAPADRHAPGREIDPRLLDSRQGTERLFDRLDAAAAMNGGDGEVSLAQAAADVAAREQQLVVGRAASIDPHRQIRQRVRSSSSNDLLA